MIVNSCAKGLLLLTICCGCVCICWCTHFTELLDQTPSLLQLVSPLALFQLVIRGIKFRADSEPDYECRRLLQSTCWTSLVLVIRVAWQPTVVLLLWYYRALHKSSLVSLLDSYCSILALVAYEIYCTSQLVVYSTLLVSFPFYQVKDAGIFVTLTTQTRINRRQNDYEKCDSTAGKRNKRPCLDQFEASVSLTCEQLQG